MRIINFIVASMFIACGALAQVVTVPNIFVAGQPARAADVNANFTALLSAINAQSTRLAKLEQTITVTPADVVGVYTSNSLQVNVAPDYVAALQGTGTYTLNADNTFSFSGAQSGWKTNLVKTVYENSNYTYVTATPATDLIQIPIPSTPITNGGTWAISATNQIILTFPHSTLSWQASPGMAIATSTGTDLNSPPGMGFANLVIIMRHP